MVVYIVGHVQWRCALNASVAPGKPGRQGRAGGPGPALAVEAADDLGSGRITVSDIEVPIMFENLVWSGRAVAQSGKATEP
jgi:hypothetical protein